MDRILDLKKPKPKKKKPPAWKNLPEPHELERDGFCIKNLKPDAEGWNDPAYARPAAYELVYLTIDEKVVKGWWTGINWDGLRLKKPCTVTKWKLIEEIEER